MTFLGAPLHGLDGVLGDVVERIEDRSVVLAASVVLRLDEAVLHPPDHGKQIVAVVLAAAGDDAKLGHEA